MRHIPKNMKTVKLEDIIGHRPNKMEQQKKRNMDKRNEELSYGMDNAIKRFTQHLIEPQKEVIREALMDKECGVDIDAEEFNDRMERFNEEMSMKPSVQPVFDDQGIGDEIKQKLDDYEESGRSMVLEARNMDIHDIDDRQRRATLLAKMSPEERAKYEDSKSSYKEDTKKVNIKVENNQQEDDEEEGTPIDPSMLM